MKMYVSEFIGTFFLFLVLVLVSNNADLGLMPPVAIGTVLAAMTFAGVQISGAHFNPSISIGTLVSEKINRMDLPYYFVAQIFGVVLASFIGSYMHQSNTGTAIEMITLRDPFSALLAEFFGTFSIVFVYLNLKRTSINPGTLGGAVGGIMVAVCYAFGGISGGFFNPAIWLGTVITGMTHPNDAWVYLVGEIVGALAAGSVFIYCNSQEGQL